MCNFLISFLASLFAAAIVLIIDRMRLPKLIIITNNDVNALICRVEKQNKDERWKSVRAKVLNRPMPILFRWLIRQTAENCRAIVSIINEGDEILFSMKGRWIDTPQLSHLPINEGILKILYPDPVNITVDEYQVLDIIIMKEGDIEAYGWNNEAYFNNWKTPNYRLSKGKYKVKIDITTQNGVSFSKISQIEVGENIKTTFFIS